MGQLVSKEVNIETFKVKAEVNQSMIDDLSKFQGFNFESILETELLREKRKSKIKKVLERLLK